MVLSNGKQDLAKIIGKAILYASISFAIASCAMSSVFSVRNFTKDQRTLDNGVCALRDYMMIGIVWAIGTTLILYSSAKLTGAIAAVVMNAAIMAWIWWTYQKAFKECADKHKLEVPGLFEAKCS